MSAAAAASGQGTMEIQTALFVATVLPGNLVVMSIPTASVAKCAWWIIREYGQHRPDHSSFSSLIMDDDGLSVVCDPQSLALIKFLMRPDEFTLSESYWRAVVIRSSGSGDEVPGAVYCLANALSSQGLSILHISTFEAEVFLIQEQHLAVVFMILKEFEDPLKAVALLDEACRETNQRMASTNSHSRLSINPTADISQASIEDTYPADDDSEVKLDVSWITPQSKLELAESPPVPAPIYQPPIKADGLKLSVLPQPVILAKLLHSEKNWEECAKVLTKLLLFDERYNPFERVARDSYQGKPINKADLRSRAPGQAATFLWGIWQQGDEVTLLMDEDDMYSLPSHVLTRSPQRWKAVKLCGRPIAFNETGVVSAMSRVETSIPTLNISTTITNCTLVPELLLDSTLARLAEVLNCPVHDPEP